MILFLTNCLSGDFQLCWESRHRVKCREYPDKSQLLGIPNCVCGLSDVDIYPKRISICLFDYLQAQFPVVKARTMQQLLKDYDYNFAVERQT